ncbi:hypothetical protein EXE53_27620 [Halorubrum sp. SD626R]|uniref:amidase family protein n=1 Tax=Halorubrum sp. SD626R TaxID=1419722 RepID=UPI0010F7284C|nr:amidase family protein [Halorubrum sp. SD626R]TKX77248.1 hypothetical protein EXE53_27620 [Halorubrum sp. SD626R]
MDELEERAAAVDPEIEALVAEEGRWERLRDQAAALTERYPDPADRPPLYGVPVGVKDIFHVEELPTRAGSDLPPGVITGDEAAAVTALRRAGALVLGKTVTTEFAHMSPGPTRNPHDTDRTPGGSSSGSAAAVAAGLCPVAFGTQTIGSVIRPAAFCGVVGYKPSFGRISTEGVIPLSESVDHVGVFTQDTAGVSLVAPLLCDSWRTLPAPTERPTIGVPDGAYLEQASDTALDAFEDHLDALTAAGYDVVRVDDAARVDVDTPAGAVTCWSVPAHNDPEGPNAGPNGSVVHPPGFGCGFLLSVGGRTVFWPGDSDALDGFAELDVSIFLANIGGGGLVSDRRAAADLAEELDPDLVVPIHYDTFDRLEADGEAFAGDVAARSIPVALDARSANQ